MKKQHAIWISLVIIASGVVAYGVLYPSSERVEDQGTPLERQAELRRAHARAMQDSMRDQGAGRITIDTTDYGDVTLRLDMPQCDSNFLSNFTAAPKVQRKLRELRFTGVMCQGGLTKLGPSDW